MLRPAERAHGRHVGAATTTTAACTRRRPTRWSAARSTWRRSITKGEQDLLNPVGHQLHPGLPRPRHPRVGRPHPVVATRRGATSTSAGCSTTWRSRSSTAPSGWSSSRTTDALWARIRRTISAFLVNEWRKGALFGLTPDEAFYVKCDGETNPAEGIDAGQVVCEIGVAPVKPAEFVIFRLAQFSGGTSLVTE